MGTVGAVGAVLEPVGAVEPVKGIPGCFGAELRLYKLEVWMFSMQRVGAERYSASFTVDALSYCQTITRESCSLFIFCILSSCILILLFN